MQIIKKSQRKNPKISIILLDWGVRESFHFLHYISKQNINRNLFEIVIIEYYSNISKAIKKFESEVDTWALLEMPPDAYYHKHLMYNAGLAMSLGEYIIICDSDAMVKPTFLESILIEFQKNPNIVLHLDQFRNNRRDFYPFNYPSFEEVTGKGCINIIDDKTTGMTIKDDLIHNRNYGACFCAKKELLIKIGGADEHIDFIGHICGPYDFTFRLINIGCKEVWHESEFLYHTWHPGQAGENNYLGPHDGLHVSTTSLEAIYTKRVEPHVINPIIKQIRQGDNITEENLQKNLILSVYSGITKIEFLQSKLSREWAEKTYNHMLYNGYNILKENKMYIAIPGIYNIHSLNTLDDIISYKSYSLKELKKQIDADTPKRSWVVTKVSGYRIVLSRFKNIIQNKMFPILVKIPTKINKAIRLFCNKLTQSKIESRYFIDNMKALLVNINLADKQGKKVYVIISSNNELVYLHMAIKLRLVSNINLIDLRNEHDSKFSLINLNLNGSNIILISRKSYIEYSYTKNKEYLRINNLFVV